jgi:hypothetical protein
MAIGSTLLAFPDHLGAKSGGEQRLLRIAASLGCSEVFVNLAENIIGLDLHTQRLVLAAIAHSGGKPLGPTIVDQTHGISLNGKRTVPRSAGICGSGTTGDRGH